MLLQNKNLFLGAAAAIVLWLIVYFSVVSRNWSDYAANVGKAQAASGEWEEYYKPRPGLLSKTEAEEALRENQGLLSANLTKLQRIELGEHQVLLPFTVQAAGSADPNNYFDQMRIKIVNRAVDTLHLTIDNRGLGLISEKAGEDPVPVKLLRLYMVDTFINACQKAGVTRIATLKHYAPRLIAAEGDEAEAAEEDAPPAAPPKKGAPTKTPAQAGASRLVQFPMKVWIQGPEKCVGKLLFELQQPSDGGHGYLCLRGLSVTARDTSSGLADAAIAVAGLLSESYVKDQGIVLKSEDERPGGGRKVDLRSW